MSGTLNSISTRRQYSFSDLAASGTIVIPLVRAIDVTDATSIDLIVRVSSATVNSGATLRVLAIPISLSSEEPDADFLGSSVASVSVTTTTGPELLLANLSTPFGHMVRIALEATQAVGSQQTITATLSIDLLMRDQ